MIVQCLKSGETPEDLEETGEIIGAVDLTIDRVVVKSGKSLKNKK